MRLADKTCDEMQRFLHASLEHGANFFDHADIYGGGQSERIFGEALAKDGTIKREDLFLQSKCGIRQGFFDFSKEHIISSVDGILSRLQTEYLDALLLHRPDALVEPEEVAEAFDELYIVKLNSSETVCASAGSGLSNWVDIFNSINFKSLLFVIFNISIKSLI
jgi:predicted oxidoreductase